MSLLFPRHNFNFWRKWYNSKYRNNTIYNSCIYTFISFSKIDFISAGTSNYINSCTDIRVSLFNLITKEEEKMNTRMLILLAILCYGSFVLDIIIGKYYVISMISYGFYTLLINGMIINKITIPDVNMIWLTIILSTTFSLYFIYTIYKLIKAITRNETNEKEELKDTGGDTVVWRKIS